MGNKLGPSSYEVRDTGGSHGDYTHACGCGGKHGCSGHGCGRGDSTEHGFGQKKSRSKRGRKGR